MELERKQHINEAQELLKWIFKEGKRGKSSQEHLTFEPALVLERDA